MLLAAIALTALLVAGLFAVLGGGRGSKPGTGGQAHVSHGATGANRPGSSLVRSGRRVVRGHSVLGRPIFAVDLGTPALPRKLLVVGCVHGNECAGIAIARELERFPPPLEADLWLIPDVNPDGFARGTRQNGHGVDLNRNFPWRWRPLGRPGDLHYSGPSPLSEPESRFARHLILRLRPRITIWFHQPLSVVDESGGSVAIERRYSRLAGLPLVRLPRYPGSAASWQNHALRGTTAFVVELPPGPLSREAARRYAEGILDLGGDGPGI